MNPPLHPLDRCAFCGATRQQANLHEAPHKATYQPCLVCDDPIECSRRASAEHKRQRGEPLLLGPRPVTGGPENEDVRAA